MYIVVSNNIISVDVLPNAQHYNFQILTEQQTAFYLANPTASISEVLAMELNPPPEPIEPTEPEPTIEERVETNEDALDELIQYVYGGA